MDNDTNKTFAPLSGQATEAGRAVDGSGQSSQTGGMVSGQQSVAGQMSGPSGQQQNVAWRQQPQSSPQAVLRSPVTGPQVAPSPSVKVSVEQAQPSLAAQPATTPVISQPQTDPARAAAELVGRNRSREAFVDKATGTINWVMAFLEVVMGVRFFFQLFGANASNVFVSMVYQLTGIFAGPFIGIFGRSPAVGRFHFEFETIVGMVIYGLVWLGLVALVRLFR